MRIELAVLALFGIDRAEVIVSGFQLRVGQIGIELHHLAEGGDATGPIGERKPAILADVQTVVASGVVEPLTLGIHSCLLGGEKHQSIVRVVGNEALGEVTLLAPFLILRERLGDSFAIPTRGHFLQLIVQLGAGVVFHQLLNNAHQVPAVQTGGSKRNDAVLFELVTSGFQLFKRGGHLDAAALENGLLVVHGQHADAGGIARELAIQRAQIQRTGVEALGPAVILGKLSEVVGAAVCHIVTAEVTSPVEPETRQRVGGGGHFQRILNVIGRIVGYIDLHVGMLRHVGGGQGLNGILGAAVGPIGQFDGLILGERNRAGNAQHQR